MNERYQKRLEYAEEQYNKAHGKDRDDWLEVVLMYRHLLECKLPHRVIGGVYSPCLGYGHQKVP